VAQPAAGTHGGISGSVITTDIVAVIVRDITNVVIRAIVIGIHAPIQERALVMKRAHIYQQDQLAGVLESLEDGSYRFTYEPGYHGEPVSLTMSRSQAVWSFPDFPAPFEGLLPEGGQLDALLRIRKLDRQDLFGQLLAVGQDVVGSLRIEAIQ
jgi:serine/threonine-protein kinase HipA